MIDRARESRIGRILNPGIDLASSRNAISIAERYPEVFAAVGVHPNSSLSWSVSSRKELKELATHQKVVAIGEIGLDYHRDRAPHHHQLDVFREQLEIAAEMNLPVIIHNREATSDILSILEKWYSELEPADSRPINRLGVLHSYSEGSEVAEKIFSLNFMIGLTGPITFKNAISLQKTVSCISIENIIIETDSPFLTPHPHRGTRNEPAYVRLIAEKLASLQGLSPEMIENITTVNSNKLFKWRDIG